MNVYADLFLTFAKIGAFTFGGGYAMIPLIRRETAEKGKWISDEELTEIVAVAESTPGPIAVNAATYVGSRAAGFFGALLATLGVTLPSFCVILALSFLHSEFHELTPVRYAFFGIRAGVLALILRALFLMWKQTPKKVFSYAVFAAAFAVCAFLPIHPVIVIAACAAAGIVFSLVSERRRTEK
ncbi:MAG: chromate transporter [Clostridia bacterium]|nr:chromate transporter [Clostridia bacterium]